MKIKLDKLRASQKKILAKLKEKRDMFELAEDETSLKVPHKKWHMLLWLVFAFIIIMFIWAYFANLDEITTAQGKVIPSQKTKVIQNLEGGIIKSIPIKEGQLVQKNQVLMQLSDIRFSSDYREEKLKELALRLKIKRLKAELQSKPFSISSEIKKTHPDIAQSEQALYESRVSEYTALKQQKELLNEEINMTEPLVKEGAASKVEVLRLRQRLTSVDAKLSNFRSETLKELNAAQTEVSRLKEDLLSIKDRLERTDVRSPVRGIVKQIFITTEGGVVKPGMPLVEIVPLDDTLLIEAKVRPRDIGFLHVGQKTSVKISAFDFSIYGSIPGKVEHISADTSIDDKGNHYYEIWVRTDRNFIIKDDEKLRIIPGMQVSVDILTGHKSVMDYILKPILKARRKALSER